MILLIPSFQELNLINLTDLNSIMILLIPVPKSSPDSAKNIGDRQKAETPKIGGVAEIYD